MNWSKKQPTRGDMLRVALGGIYHFGIYVSDGEVIQFGLSPALRVGIPDSEVAVVATDMKTFLVGGEAEVAEFDASERVGHRTADEVVAYARSKIGTRGYSILYNNCEHFAYECVSGRRVCHQTDDLRAMFRKMPVVDVYIAELLTEEPIGSLECEARMEEIRSVSNERLKREKYFVWRLLCYALERSFGMRGKRLDFTRAEHGGWKVSEAEFSLSHSEGALAIAVSRAPVGVDIERVTPPRVKNFEKYIMTDAELAAFYTIPVQERLNRLFEVWTAKEAIFKSKGLSAFHPTKTDTLSAKIKSESIEIRGEKYVWSVATDTPEKIRVFTGIDLTKLK